MELNKSGLQAQQVHKSNMSRLSYELPVGLREIRINLMKVPLTYEELRLKECPRDKIADGKLLDRRRSLCRHERLQEDADEDGYSSENDAGETDVAPLFVALGEEEHAHEEAGEED